MRHRIESISGVRPGSEVEGWKGQWIWDPNNPEFESPVLTYGAHHSSRLPFPQLSRRDKSTNIAGLLGELKKHVSGAEHRDWEMEADLNGQ